VAASGPSLTTEIADRCRGQHVIAINDAWRRLPFADVLYACDEAWWDIHKGASAFRGQRWSSHGSADHDDKRACADRYALNLVAGAEREGFSLDPARIHYGSNSGFQGINLGILFGARPVEILLVGFDMRAPDGQTHFFGPHPSGLRNDKNYGRFIPAFNVAARKLPPDIKIINCTPGSALACFPKADLNDALTAAA
jgi:hypothetical protein